MALAPGSAHELDLVRRILLKHGWNATAYQIVNPGISHWFSRNGDAVIGFVGCTSTRVVAGGPVCSRDRLPRVLREWERDAQSAGERLCYFGASGRLQALLQASPDHASIVIGAQPVWNPQHWRERVQRYPSLRAQFRRAANKGVRITEWPIEKAEISPLLRACLSAWLETRGLPPLHFLVEPETLSLLQGRRVFVAEQHDRVVAFLTLSPVPARRGWLTEQFPRLPSAPNGTVELLMNEAACTVGAEQADYLTMGLVPLSPHGVAGHAPNPWWVDAVLGSIRTLGRKFYNFGGLDAFKSKFHPEYWEPIYAISREKQFSPYSLYAIARAFTGEAPAQAIGRAVLKHLKSTFHGENRRAIRP
jgi:phosphatidylglycerol lysyltransferase